VRFDLITIFPEFFAGPLDHGIVRRAREAGIVQVHVQDLREFTRTGTKRWMIAHSAAAREWC